MGYRNPLTVLGRGVVIIGSAFKTAFTGQRIEMGPATVNSNGVAIAFYTGDAADETAPASIGAYVSGSGPGPGGDGVLALVSPTYGVLGGPLAELDLRSTTTDGTSGSNATLSAHDIDLATPGGAVVVASGRIQPKVARTALTFSGTVFQDFGSGFGPASYTVDATGWVKLQGLAFNNSAGAASAGALVAVGLPAPASTLDEPIPTMNGATGPMLLQIAPSGQLTILAGSCPAAQNVVLTGGYQT